MRLHKICCIIFVLQLLCCNICSADDSRRLITYPPQKIMGFRGLDTQANAPLLADGRATDLQNIKLSHSFDIRKRYGYSVIDTTLDDLDIDSPPITGIFYNEYSNGNDYVFAFVGSKIKYNVGNRWQALSGTAVVTEGKDNQWQCTSALDQAICTNDVDKPIKISSGADANLLDVSDLTDELTKAKSVIWFRNYLIVANTVEAATERPTRFRWSNVGTIETWSDDDFNDIAELGGDEIIGMAELYGNLFVFFKNSIYKVTLVGGDDVFTFDKVITGIGAISRDSIQVVRMNNNQSAIIFLDEDKRVYLFTGLGVVDLGQIIQPTLDGLSAIRLEYSVAAWDGQSYYLSVSNGSNTTNNLLLEYQIEIGEWTKHTDINANAMGRVVDSSVPKTYFGNYDSFVYWMDNPDNSNDVDGATGVVDSVGTTNLTSFITGAQVLIDTSLTAGTYSGATVKITSGTAAGEERVILESTATSLVVTTAFSTTPDSTSNYSIGAIDANYDTKWYDLGDSARKKNWKMVYFWAREASNNNVTVGYATDFASTEASSIESLAPSSNSLWDQALWDVGTWGTTGDKFYREPLAGVGRFISLEFSNSLIDETFKIYGYNLIAEALDVR